MTKPKRSSFKTYTKEKMNLILNVALVDMQFPFILAFIGRENIAETMGQLIVVEIVGVFFVYCLKSFFETKESEKIRIEEKKLEQENSDI
jgi:hypothetical protein